MNNHLFIKSFFFFLGVGGGGGGKGEYFWSLKLLLMSFVRDILDILA